MSILKLKELFFVVLLLVWCNYVLNAQNKSHLITSNSINASQTQKDLSLSSVQLDSNPEIEEVRRAINAVNAVWVKAWAEGDAALIPKTFTADGRELVADGKIYKGSKQILTLMLESMKKRGGRAKLTVTTTDVWLDGNTAFETGTAVYEFKIGGEMQSLERRYFTVWKRQSKRQPWKIYSNVGVAKQ